MPKPNAEIVNAQSYFNKLNQLEGKAALRAMKKATNAGGQEILKETRVHVKEHMSKEHSREMTKRTTVSKDKQSVSSDIGGKKGTETGRILHLVDKGFMHYISGFIPGKHFMEKARTDAQDRAVKKAGEKARIEFEKEWKKGNRR